MTKGYFGLKASKIAYVAGVSKTLIYRYFGNVEELFKVYLSQKDFWVSMQTELRGLLDANQHDHGKEFTKQALQGQISYFFENKEMQEIMRWQISQPNEIARSLADARERVGEELLRIIEPHFRDSDVNFRAILAVIVPGIYYLVLNAKVNGSTFCGIDINKSEDMKQVQKAVGQLVEWSYENVRS